MRIFPILNCLAVNSYRVFIYFLLYSDYIICQYVSFNFIMLYYVSSCVIFHLCHYLPFLVIAHESLKIQTNPIMRTEYLCNTRRKAVTNQKPAIPFYFLGLTGSFTLIAAKVRLLCFVYVFFNMFHLILLYSLFVSFSINSQCIIKAMFLSLLTPEYQ